MNFFTYILYSELRDRYYIGSTENIERRLERHNQGATKSTKSGRPWKVVYNEEYQTKSEAIKRELYIKRMKSRSYIESLINSSKDKERPD